MKHIHFASTSILAMVLLLSWGASPCRAIELLHYAFDQVDGTGPFTTPDVTGRGNTGTLFSMDDTDLVPGRVGNALFFHGGTSTSTRDRVEVPTADVNVETDLNRTYTQFTFAAFVKPIGIEETDTDTTWIAGKLGTGNTRGWQIGLTGTDELVVPPENRQPHDVVVSLFDGPLTTNLDNEYYSGPADGPTPPNPPDPTALPNDQWSHVAFTFSGTNETESFFRMYINGARVVDTTTELTLMNGVNTRAFQVGNRGDSRADSWSGLIDEVRLYDEALTDEQIAALIPPLPPAPFGDYNEDGFVDAADYAVWRKNVGGGTALPNDNDLGTPIGTAHYDLWRANFGLPEGSAAGFSSMGVPEPTSASLALAAIVAFAAWRRRDRGVSRALIGAPQT